MEVRLFFQLNNLQLVLNQLNESLFVRKGLSISSWKRLAGCQWLDDEVIFQYLNLLKKYFIKPEITVYLLSSHFYSYLIRSNDRFDRVHKWINKQQRSILDAHQIYLPINHNGVQLVHCNDLSSNSYHRAL